MPSAHITRTAESLLGVDSVRLGTPADAVEGVVPRVIVEPAAGEAVGAVLEWASREKLCVLVRGSGTKLGWGPAPRQVDILISTVRLNAVVAHRHGDLTATIQAGATLGDVNRALAEHRQWIPLDPPSADRATIGGARGDQRQRAEAASLWRAARFDHRDRVRASRRAPREGRRHRRQERRGLRPAASVDRLVRQPRRYRDCDLQALSADCGITHARRRAVEPGRSRKAGTANCRRAS